MANFFDSLRDKAFDITTQVMGYDASWIPRETPEAEPITARVHFKIPDEKQELGGVDYMPPTPFMEYRAPFFEGLYEAVRANNGQEPVTIDGKEYIVMAVDKIADGATFRAYLDPVI